MCRNFQLIFEYCFISLVMAHICHDCFSFLTTLFMRHKWHFQASCFVRYVWVLVQSVANLHCHFHLLYCHLPPHVNAAKCWNGRYTRTMMRTIYVKAIINSSHLCVCACRHYQTSGLRTQYSFDRFSFLSLLPCLPFPYFIN